MIHADLAYSSVNEDFRTEARALLVGPNDEVLCIAGSGARALDLLVSRPRSLVAVDVNPVQSALLMLKVAAMRRLDYSTYAAFLGLDPLSPRERLDLYRSLRGDLGCHARWFDAHPQAIASGILYAGRWERYYAKLSRLARLLRARTLDALFDCDQIDEQRHVVRDAWDKRWWRGLFSLVCSPWVSRFCFGDEAYFRYPAFPVGRTLHRLMLRSLDRTLARDNFMMNLVFCGRLSPSDLPPHLTQAGYQRIRSHLDALCIRTDDIRRVLIADSQRFTRLSLSDVASFLDAREFEALCRIAVTHARPGARVCLRQFLTRHEMPDSLTEYLIRETDLERELAEDDHAFAYEFQIGVVRH